MAIIHYEHFDLYGTDYNALLARGYASIGVAHQLVAAGRTGTHCLQNNASGVRLLQITLPSALTVVGQGCALRYLTTPNNNTWLDENSGLRFGVSGNTSLIRVMGNDALGLSVYLNSTLIGSSAPGLLAAGAYAWVEAKATSGAGTAGAVEVRLNGTTVINLTGLSLTAPWTTVALGSDNTSAQPTTQFDDWVVWDTTDTVNNDFMGDTFVIVAPPSADGTPSDFTPSSGTARWDMVDETTPNDADYITGNAVGDVNEFSHVAVNLPVGAVAAIATQVRALKTDAGASSIEVGIASGTSTSMSPEHALATGALSRSHIANRNPNGNVPWTQATAQAAKLRVRRAA